jgi:hypothetical protein
MRHYLIRNKREKIDSFFLEYLLTGRGSFGERYWAYDLDEPGFEKEIKSHYVAYGGVLMMGKQVQSVYWRYEYFFGLGYHRKWYVEDVINTKGTSNPSYFSFFRPVHDHGFDLSFHASAAVYFGWNRKKTPYPNKPGNQFDK